MSQETGSEEDVLSRVEDGVAVITLNRPKVMNALNQPTLQRLASAIARVAEDPEVRALVLTGAGEKAFVAGADISAMAQLTQEQARELAELGHGVMESLEELSVPVIAAVNGFALGGGCELALACDLILASNTASFGQPEVNLGVIPGFGGTQRLSRRVGLGQARLLIYSGKRISAEDAHGIGLVDLLFEPEALLEEALKLARSLGTKSSPLAVSTAKRLLLRGWDMDLKAANRFEATAFSTLFTSHDQREGMAAFLEKRKPEFKGS